MVLQKGIERSASIGTESKRGGLRHQPEIERRRFNQASKCRVVILPFEKLPRSKEAIIIEQPLQVGDQKRELREMKRLMDLAPIELPYRCGRAVARTRGSEMGCDQRRVGPIKQPGRYP